MSHRNRVNCSTCGADNPGNLVFCRECGQKLAQRLVAPTPPVAIAQDAFAPHVRAVLREPGPPMGEPCRECGSRLDIGGRFCTTCGASATPKPVATNVPRVPDSVPPPPSTRANGAPPPERKKGGTHRPPAPTMPSRGTDLSSTVFDPPEMAAAVRASMAPSASPGVHGPPIAPLPVVAVRVDAPSEPPPLRVCTRCRGTTEGSAQFCRFCGTSLAAAPAIALHAPAPPPPAMSARSPAPPPVSSDAIPPVLAPRFAGKSPSARPPPTAPIPVVTPPSRPPSAPPPPVARPPATAHLQPVRTVNLADTYESSMEPRPPLAATLPSQDNQTSTPKPASVIPPAPSTRRSSAPPRANGSVPPPRVAAGLVGMTPHPAGVGAKDGTLLFLVEKDGTLGRSFPVGDGLDIGRSEGALLLDDGYVSSRHARIVRRDGKLFLRDLDSVNGVYVRLPRSMSSEQSVEHELRDQDLFLVGQQVIRFEVVADGERGPGPATEHGTLLFGSPAAPRYARLSQRTVEGVTRDVFYIRKVDTVLGRESGDIVFTEDPFLSRRHASVKVNKAERRFTLVDLGSSNGTFVRLRGEVPLRDGDEFRVGQQLCRIDSSSGSGAGGPPAMAPKRS
ncbi:MAG: FHA domain-containing protein [Polyangiaceae bacterium]